MQKLSKRFKDRPMTPEQSIVYWTEYVIRHNGASHLISPATRLSWVKFLMLDVILVVTLLLVSCVFLIRRIVRIFLNFFAPVSFFSVFDKPKNKKL